MCELIFLGQKRTFQVEILFKLAEAAHPGKKTLSLSDIECIDPQRLKRVSYIPRPITIEAVSTKEERSVVTAVSARLFVSLS